MICHRNGDGCSGINSGRYVSIVVLTLVQFIRCAGSEAHGGEINQNGASLTPVVDDDIGAADFEGVRLDDYSGASRGEILGEGVARIITRDVSEPPAKEEIAGDHLPGRWIPV